MIYPITVYGDPLLRQTAKPIEKDYPELAKLIEDMFETMYFSDGVGLAAPQIGLSIRIFVIDATTYADEEPELANFKRAFINPEIIERTGDGWAMNEGCLSLPDIREDITRPETVRIKYMDENFVAHDETYSGYAARVIQHEYDHLDGILFIDLLNPLRRRLLKGRLTAISKGKVSTKYRQKLPGKK